MAEPALRYKFKDNGNASRGSKVKKKRSTGGRIKAWLFTIILLSAFLYLSYQSILAGIGRHLISVDLPIPADAIIVVGGSDGTQEIKALELYRTGLSSRVLFIGGQAGWHTSQGELMAKHVKTLGLAGKAVIVAPPTNTLSESVDWIKDRYINYGWRCLVVVAPPFETLRVRRVFARVYPAPIYKIRVVASEHREFGPENWWQTPGGVETVLTEYSRLLALKLTRSRR